MESSTTEKYTAAVAFIGTAKMLSNEQRLQAYGLFKQASVGDASGGRPWAIDPIGQAKWDAWQRLSGLSSNDAMAAYINLAESLGMIDGGSGGSCGSVGGGGGCGGLMGPVQSTMADMSVDSDPSRQRGFQNGEELFKAASAGDVAGIEAILGAPLSEIAASPQVLAVNAQDENGQTALHWACNRGQHQVVALLLMYPGVDVGKKDGDSMAALHYAVLNEDAESAALLLKAGADPAQLDGDGETPISLATGGMKELFAL
mmetsp:Transcript_42205/g.83095  ORF Transcript_42205/g.83095 Transcript_42205/m.83095 type:complete len:259 (-) Transcript_42205:262-1038(-)